MVHGHGGQWLCRGACDYQAVVIGNGVPSYCNLFSHPRRSNGVHDFFFFLVIVLFLLFVVVVLFLSGKRELPHGRVDVVFSVITMPPSGKSCPMDERMCCFALFPLHLPARAATLLLLLSLPLSFGISPSRCDL